MPSGAERWPGPSRPSRLPFRPGTSVHGPFTIADARIKLTRLDQPSESCQGTRMFGRTP